MIKLYLISVMVLGGLSLCCVEASRPNRVLALEREHLGAWSRALLDSSSSRHGPSQIAGGIGDFSRECPQIPPLEDFDLLRFSGQWFPRAVASRLPVACNILNFTPFNDTVFYEEYSAYGNMSSTVRPDGITSVTFFDPPVQSYVLSLVDGAFIPGFALNGTLEAPISTTVSVLETDYTSYAVLVQCLALGPVRLSGALLLSRGARLPPATGQQLMANLQVYGFSTRDFRILRCPVLKPEIRK